MPAGGRTDLSRLREETGDSATVFKLRGGETRRGRLASLDPVPKLCGVWLPLAVVPSV